MLFSCGFLFACPHGKSLRSERRPPLAGLTNLTELDLHFNDITDITPLSGMTNLTTLNLFLNNITDPTPLSALANLTTLNHQDFNAAVIDGDDLEDRPVIIMMFGGSFIGGSRTSPDIVELCTRYAKMGYVAVAIDYRLTLDLLIFICLQIRFESFGLVVPST